MFWVDALEQTEAMKRNQAARPAERLVSKERKGEGVILNLSGDTSWHFYIDDTPKFHMAASGLTERAFITEEGFI